jgi:peptide/nickel transport system ATP-binding protein
MIDPNPPAGSQPLLEVTALTKHYPGPGGGHTACQDVSFQIEQGGALALVGESGAGKSTVIRLVAGLEQSNSGSITIRGAEAGRHTRRKSARLTRAATVQIVHQDPYSASTPGRPSATASTNFSASTAAASAPKLATGRLAASV